MARERQMNEQHADDYEPAKGWTCRAIYNAEGGGRIEIEFATVDEWVEQTHQMTELMWPTDFVLETVEWVEPC